MPLTTQKLHLRLRELRQAAEEPGTLLTPLTHIPADGPMARPPATDDPHWQLLEIGQTWGLTHSTSWLQTTLAPSISTPDQIPVLQLLWEQDAPDSLLHRLEATAFLDDVAIGGFDWRHRLLALPQNSSAGQLLQDGQTHRLTIQV